MARIMAIDYGDKRTGIAFTDLSGQIVGELLTIQESSPKKLAARCHEHAMSHDVDTIALGWPITEDAEIGTRALKTRKLSNRLKGFGLKVILVDERYTSVEAEEILHDKGIHITALAKSHVDAVAAALILERYLEQSQ